MTKIVAFANQKGGVGKTSSAVNLAAGLVAEDKKVLLIDFDPQGNASTGFGVSRFQRKLNIYQVMVGEGELDEAEVETQYPNLKLIPSNVDLAAAEFDLRDAPNREFIFKNKIQSRLEAYDYIIIDCSPSLGLMTINALTAADSLIIPMQCEFYALEGLAHLLRTVDLIKNSLNPALELEGVLLTMYDNRNNLTQQVENDVRDYLGRKVYQTTIPRNVRISEAPSHGQPVVFYDKSSSGAVAYRNLTNEFLQANIEDKQIQNNANEIAKNTEQTITYEEIDA